MVNHSFFKFLLVGVLNTIIGLSFMYISLNIFHLHYWISTFIGNSIGAVVSYFLNKIFTFQSKSPFGSSVIRFVLVIICCYVVAYQLGLSVTEGLLDVTGILPAQYIDEVAILIGSGLYTIMNYFGQRYFVFRTNN
ncbi:GtrA family protein [Caldibacillus lycopersici]|uniref:GtrA family protein n=1 Tax=Perspicuibacillus lycopersici TaxID=1325689 RepID=A0AAE3LRV8_9BACI|nr:GtrA family protein [Perspicuibacillus lycopersici]MCU9612133.1 GtrA family protein [Perspicuibacillus lycopersici]